MPMSTKTLINIGTIFALHVIVMARAPGCAQALVTVV